MPKKTLTIEWRHLEQDGLTCTRCGDTGRSLRRAVAALRRRCRSCDVDIRFVETKLPPSRLRESNAIFFNGVPLERALGDAAARANHCSSCSTLLNEPAVCRTVERDGKTYDAIPESLIRQAACRVAGCGEYTAR